MAEYLPSAHAILWFLAAFVSLWGWSLVWRGFAHAGPAPRRWWQPRWRLAGTGLAVQALAAAAGFGGAWAYGMVQSGEEGLDAARVPVGPWSAAGWGVLAFAAVVIAIGYRGDRAKGRLRCRKCWYDMSAAVAAEGGTRTCPECGKIARNERDLSRPRRRWRVVATGLVIAAASYGVMVVPRIQSAGWVGAVPTTAMIAGIAWLPDSVILEVTPGDVDGSLLARSYYDRNWGWQDWLIGRWVRRVAASPASSLPSLRRALLFLRPEQDDEYFRVSFERLLTVIVSGPEADRSAACEALPWGWLGQIEPPRDTVNRYLEGLIARLDDTDSNVADSCAALIGFCPAEGERAVPGLLAMAPRASLNGRSIIAGVLQRIAYESPASRYRLVDAMRAGSEPTTSILAAALGTSMMMDDARLRTGLRELLDSPNEDGAYAAGAALRYGNVIDQTLIDGLVRGANSGRSNRILFLELLVGINQEAWPLEAEVGGLLDDDSAEMRERAASILRDWARERRDISVAMEALEKLAGGTDMAAQIARETLEIMERLPPDDEPEG